MAGDNHAFAVYQDGVCPPKLPDTGRHSGDLLVRMGPRIPRVRHQRANRPKLDLRGEIHTIRVVTTRSDNLRKPK